MLTLRLQLPLPPTLNQSYFCAQTGGGIRMVLTQKAKDFKEMVEEATLIAWKQADMDVINERTRFTLRLIMMLEKNSRDVDANIKLVMDSIMSGVKAATDLDGLSDRRVFQVTLEKRLLAKSRVGLYVALEVYPR